MYPECSIDFMCVLLCQIETNHAHFTKQLCISYVSRVLQADYNDAAKIQYVRYRFLRDLRSRKMMLSTCEHLLVNTNQFWGTDRSHGACYQCLIAIQHEEISKYQCSSQVHVLTTVVSYLNLGRLFNTNEKVYNLRIKQNNIWRCFSKSDTATTLIMTYLTVLTNIPFL